MFQIRIQYFESDTSHGVRCLQQELLLTQREEDTDTESLSQTGSDQNRHGRLSEGNKQQKNPSAASQPSSHDDSLVWTEGSQK